MQELMLEQYKTRNVRKIICSFMDAFVISSTAGRGTKKYKDFLARSMTFENDTSDRVKTFWNTVIHFTDAAQTFPLLDFLLEDEQSRFLQFNDISHAQISEMLLIQTFVKLVCTEDIEKFLYFLNLWTDEITAYAYKNFYPHFPEICRKHQIEL